MTDLVADLMTLTPEDAATMARRNLTTAQGLQAFKAAKAQIIAELSQHPTYRSTDLEKQADMLAGIEARAKELLTA